MAALQEGFDVVGIEMDEESIEIAECRIGAVARVEKQITLEVE